MGERAEARRAKAAAKYAGPSLLAFARVPLEERPEAQTFPEITSPRTSRTPNPSREAVNIALRDLRKGGPEGRVEGVQLMRVEPERRLKLINLEASKQLRIKGRDAMARYEALRILKDEISQTQSA